MSDISTDSEVQFNLDRHRGRAGGTAAGGSPAGSASESSSASSVVAHGQRRRLRVVESDSSSSSRDYTDARENASPAGVRRSGVGAGVGTVRRRLPEVPDVPAATAARAVEAVQRRLLAARASAGTTERVRLRLPEIPAGAVPWSGSVPRSTAGRRAVNEGRESVPTEVGSGAKAGDPRLRGPAMPLADGRGAEGDRPLDGHEADVRSVGLASNSAGSSLALDGPQQVVKRDRDASHDCDQDRQRPPVVNRLPPHVKLGSYRGDTCLETFLARFENLFV